MLLIDRSHGIVAFVIASSYDSLNLGLDISSRKTYISIPPNVQSTSINVSGLSSLVRRKSRIVLRSTFILAPLNTGQYDLLDRTECVVGYDKLSSEYRRFVYDLFFLPISCVSDESFF